MARRLSRQLLQSEHNNVGLRLDPRTKLFLVLTISVFVLGGLGGGGVMVWVRPALAAVPLALLLCSRRFAAAALYTVLYCVCYFGQGPLIANSNGTLGFLLLLACGLCCRFLPGFMAAYHLISTTTVSEFVAAMHRMHVTDRLVIPMSVMFRFVPTVAEEARSIQDAMQMRGVRLRNGKPGKMLEYRLIPVMTCSVRRGEELSAAALTRGLGGPARRTNVCQIGLRAPDVIIMSLCAVPYILSLLAQAGIM
jgi:energy-coupling factor transport system permease protein